MGDKTRKWVRQDYGKLYMLDARSLYFLSLSLTLSFFFVCGGVGREDFIFYFVSGAELRDLCVWGGYIIVFHSFSQQIIIS